ncbi:MAG TPA: DCC1-like thiol-disulfide oxidoreductase family protein [Polyangiaceae bacterium]|nr:DCC1-like thiol-disulfide oxidoreductase family protein [Polyangiaceae bacterium]
MDTAAWIEDLEARADEKFARVRCPRSLDVLFDPGCALCRRCVAWMQHQPSYVPLRFVPCTGDAARARYGDIPWLGDELVVVSDAGEVWVGPAGFLTCLWALEEYREWSFRLAGPAFAPLAERFFLALSHRRKALGYLFERRCEDGTCSIGR